MAKEVKSWLQHDAMFTLALSGGHVGLFCKHNNTSKRWHKLWGEIDHGTESLRGMFYLDSRHGNICGAITKLINENA